MSTRCALVIALALSAWPAAVLLMAGCSSRAEVASDVPVATETPTAAASSDAPTVPSSSAPPEPTVSASASASPSATVAPAVSASPTDVFAAKIALLDKVDDAIMRGKPDALAGLTTPGAALEQCVQASRERAPPNIEISKDCAVPAAALKRDGINVGSRAELVDEACGMSRLEKSELFYRIGGHSFKITVDSVSVGKDVHLRRIHCHRSERPTKGIGVTNCTGKWPFVTQTREFPKCPWSPP